MRIKKILDELGISEANVLEDIEIIKEIEEDADETIVYDLEDIINGKTEQD